MVNPVKYCSLIPFYEQKATALSAIIAPHSVALGR